MLNLPKGAGHLIPGHSQHRRDSHIEDGGVGRLGTHPITLRLAAEHTDAPAEGLQAVTSVAAPIDLALCSRALEQWRNRIYQFYFLRGLMAEAHGLARALGEAPVGLPREMTVWFAFPSTGRYLRISMATSRRAFLHSHGTNSRHV